MCIGCDRANNPTLLYRKYIMNYWVLMQIWHKATIITSQGLIMTLCGKFTSKDSAILNIDQAPDKQCKVCTIAFRRMNSRADWFLKQSN